MSVFSSDHYQRHNQRRMEHLASLKLPLRNKTVLELGAGVGDLSSYFLDRQCTVTAVDGRYENVAMLIERHPNVAADVVDLDPPDSQHAFFNRRYDVLFCYGLLYHLNHPNAILDLVCPLVDLCLLETCVSVGQEDSLNSCKEDESIESQSLHGLGCRPTRYWVYHQLQKHFDFVYTCVTQPSHEEFPLDWRKVNDTSQLKRAVFIASNKELDCPDLKAGLVHEHVPT